MFGAKVIERLVNALSRLLPANDIDARRQLALASQREFLQRRGADPGRPSDKNGGPRVGSGIDARVGRLHLLDGYRRLS